MPQLQRLRADHGPAVLAFEIANRDYFAASISDRGDDFFEHFTQRLDVLLADQEQGTGAYHVLVGDDGEGVATLGYRVAEHATGRGVATAAVAELCRLAAVQYGVRTVRAATSHANTASRRVLVKSGFVETAPADPASLGGKPGTWFERDVAP